MKPDTVINHVPRPDNFNVFSHLKWVEWMHETERVGRLNNYRTLSDRIHIAMGGMTHGSDQSKT